MALSKSRKIWLIVIGVLFSIVFILFLVANGFLSKKADALLRKEIAKIDTTTYHIDFDYIRVNVFSLSANIHGISVKPSRTALEKVKLSRLAKPLFEVSISSIDVSGIGILGFIRGKNIRVGRVLLENPDITVHGPQGLFPGTHSSSTGKNIFSSDTISETAVRHGELGYFEIRNANIKYIDESTNKTVLETSKLNLTIDDIEIKQPEGDTSSHVLEIGEFSLSLESHMMDLPGNFYNLQIGPLETDYNRQYIRIDSIILSPLYSKEEFAKLSVDQTDRFDLSVGSLIINGINFDSLMEKKVMIDSITISTPVAEIFRDKRYPLDLSHFPRLYQSSIAQLPVYLHIDKVHVSDAHIEYQELVDNAPIPGRVEFDKLNINILGVSNDPALITKGHSMTVDGEGMLMGKAKTNISIVMPIGDPQERFHLHGHVEPFAAAGMNPMIKPLAYVEAISGTIRGASFYTIFCRDTAVGRIQFLYTDIKAEVLKKNKEKAKAGELNKFLSFIAGALIHSSNPLKGKPIRDEKMFFIRDRNKGFFNNIWKPLQHGIISTITPGKGKEVKDMSWEEFEANWQKVLQADLELIRAGNKENKKVERKEEKAEKVETRLEEEEASGKSGTRKEKRLEKREEKLEKKEKGGGG
jgi:hypothetical protein